MSRRPRENGIGSTPTSFVPSEVEGRTSGAGAAPLDYARDERSFVR